MHNIKRIFLYVLIIFLLTGCSSINTNIKDEQDFFNQFYIKVKDSMFFSVPEYYALKNRITRQEYRILPNYLQYYYEKE